MSVLSLTDAKAHLNIAGNAQDMELQRTIDAAEAYVAGRVGPLTPTPVTERVDASGDVVSLSVTPVISVTTITPLLGGMNITPADVVLDNQYGQLLMGSGYWFVAGEYDISYVAGWSPVPADILMIVREQVRRLWGTQRGPGPQRAGQEDTTPALDIEAMIQNYDQVDGFA